MELFAISDLHIGFRENWLALQAVTPRPDAALVLAGDVCESADQLAATLDLLQPRFRQLLWCPGNHELWHTREQEPRGQAKYEQLVDVCQARGVLTPEDPYPIWEIAGERLLVAPLFLLYDYSFAPDGIAPDQAVAWAAEAGLRCADERLLLPDPYATRLAWCHARCRLTEQRLESSLEGTGLRSILINHYPLRRELARLPAIPRFQIWCGTRQTEDWHKRFRAAVVISGHLHIRNSVQVDDCRFEEVSLGYPGRQWEATRGIDAYVRPIVPRAASAPSLERGSVSAGAFEGKA